VTSIPDRRRGQRAGLTVAYRPPAGRPITSGGSRVSPLYNR